MSAAYARPRAVYFVVSDGDRVLGGGGIAPLERGDAATCELRKMYFLPEARGRGAGAAMLERCLDAARELGYATCYLETLARMDAARKLYARFGFRPLCAPMGNDRPLRLRQLLRARPHGVGNVKARVIVRFLPPSAQLHVRPSVETRSA